jgi:hypothetical protein
MYDGAVYPERVYLSIPHTLQRPGNFNTGNQLKVSGPEKNEVLTGGPV